MSCTTFTPPVSWRRLQSSRDAHTLSGTTTNDTTSLILHTPHWRSINSDSATLTDPLAPQNPQVTFYSLAALARWGPSLFFTSA